MLPCVDEISILSILALLSQKTGFLVEVERTCFIRLHNGNAICSSNNDAMGP